MPKARFWNTMALLPLMRSLLLVPQTPNLLLLIETLSKQRGVPVNTATKPRCLENLAAQSSPGELENRLA